MAICRYSYAWNMWVVPGTAQKAPRSPEIAPCLMLLSPALPMGGQASSAVQLA